MTYNQQWFKIVKDCQGNKIDKDEARKRIAELKKTKPIQPSERR